MSVTRHPCVETLASLITALRGKGLLYQKSRILVNGIEAPNKKKWKEMPFPVGTGTEGRCQLWLTPKSTSTISLHFTTFRTWRIAFLLLVRHLVYGML